jgi:VWFA-related protein
MMEIGQEASLTTLSSPTGFGTGNSVTSEFPLRHIEQFAERKLAKVQTTLRAMEQFIDSLAGLPGRKSLVYVSDGLPMRPGEDLFEAFGNEFGGGGANPGQALNTDATGLFRQLVEHANANRVTFYTLLAGGGRTRNITLTESQRNLGRVWGERVQALQVGNLKEPMEMIAEDTGGLAFTSPKTFEEDLRRMREDFETFYSLGYSRPYSGEAKKHKLEVRVRDPKLRVRHRESYREKTSEEIMASRTLSNLFFDVEDNPLGVQVEFGEEIDGAKGVRNVQLVVKVPIAHLLLLPQEQFHQGKISIFVAVRDAAGRTSPVQKVPAPIRIPNDKLLIATGQVAAFNITLQMREGEHSVVVGVRDELADVESTVRTVHSPTDATAGATTGR